ncbi:peptidoglycan endopeptidase [uncultured Sphingomonas sp.]|uniref:peptidoglycan endopeptidase n=1 Tax=uncultured Sphingomonas sp. TaxID=158754 RepID=UPI0025F3398D|nr:peptidoglycan endopeptidase [uncultured Sphingomonas sp.]
MSAGERVLAAARQLVGVRFRAQGRDPAWGLDCVGLVAVALARAGARVTVPHDCAQACGRCAFDPPDDWRPCAGDRPGDVLLCRVSAAQLHLAVRSADGIVHADAQARRVVARPGAVPWPIEQAWRWTPQGD